MSNNLSKKKSNKYKRIEIQSMEDKLNKIL